MTEISSLLLIFLCCFSVSTPLQSQDQNKRIPAHQLTDSDHLILDGVTEESLWQNIAPIQDFLMQAPVEGNEASEITKVRIAYDENNLYIAIELFDKEPSEIKAFQKKRDVSLDTDDRFLWILDSYMDGRNAYYFAINPSGVMVDGLLTIGQGTSLDLNWDGIWRVWTKVHASGWSAEIRIPFRTLNFDPVNENWGINFQRNIRRKNEEVVWSGHKRNQGLLRPQNAGVLSGLKDISQGIGLEAIPYTTARRNSISQGDASDTNYKGDFGMDVNYSITPGLKASVTYNTDFAETEVDSRQINLTRFPLFFPEQRDFFLEGSNIYSFAPTSGIRPYFSRTIGLNQGKSIPIVAGARLLGRVGNSDIAVQHVRTGSLDDTRPEDFTVARIKHNIGKESRIGLVYTRRSTDYEDDEQASLLTRNTIGADLELNTSTFLGDKNLQFQAFFVYHNAPIEISDSDFWDRTSRGMRINFPNRPWSAHASYREFGESFEPAVGFHPRVGFRRFQPSINYNPLFESSKVIRDIDFGLRFEHLMDMDWSLLTQLIRFEFFDISFISGERIGLSISREFERLNSPFDILRDESIVIPSGDYRTWTVSTELSTASFRPMAIRIDLDAGGFWSGHRTQIAGSFTVRPLAGINLTATYIHTDVDLAEGAFTTDLIRFNASIDLTPFISFTSFIQYDNLSEQLGINNRFRWIITPGTDFYLVYNHNWVDLMDRFSTLSSTATMKATYTHRF